MALFPICPTTMHVISGPVRSERQHSFLHITRCVHMSGGTPGAESLHTVQTHESHPSLQWHNILLKSQDSRIQSKTNVLACSSIVCECCGILYWMPWYPLPEGFQSRPHWRRLRIGVGACYASVPLNHISEHIFHPAANDKKKNDFSVVGRIQTRRPDRAGTGPSGGEATKASFSAVTS